MMNVKPEELLKMLQAQEEFLKKTRRMSVKVGLPANKRGVMDGDISIVQLGAVHEYGASIKHSGGTSYGYNSEKDAQNGKSRFLKKGSGYMVTGQTGEHSINIPKRSFLRLPYQVKRKEIVKVIETYYQKGMNGEISAERALGIIGAYAEGISKQSFATGGFGLWPDISEETKRRKGSSKILIDKGVLQQNISWVLSDAS